MCNSRLRHYNRKLALSTTKTWHLTMPGRQQLVAGAVGSASQQSPGPLSAIFHMRHRAAWRDQMSAQHEAFARRLHQALDYAGFDKGRARTGKLAAEFEVSRETARKWLVGDALPELERMIAIAVRMQVSFEWLSTGRGSISATGIRIGEGPATYMDRDDAKLLGLARQLDAEARKALITLLEKR